MKLKNFNEFSSELDINEKLIKFLHEGVRLVKIDNSINESNLKDFAQKEINLVVREAKRKGDTAIIEDFVPEILNLIEKFGNSGQSGGSAPYTAGAITQTLKKLLMFQPIAPIMNEKDEWFAPFDGVWQNKRCYALFKESENSDPYYLDAIIWKNQHGHTYTGSALLEGKKILSRQYVKEFPFEPKSFTIDVNEKEVSKDDWEFYVKDPKQLEEVFKFYKKK